MGSSGYREPDALKLFQESGSIPDYNEMILAARNFFNLSLSAKTEIGWIFVPGAKKPIPLKSGYEGGPWAGTQRGGVPRGRGSRFHQAHLRKRTSLHMLKVTAFRRCGN